MMLLAGSSSSVHLWLHVQPGEQEPACVDGTVPFVPSGWRQQDHGYAC